VGVVTWRQSSFEQSDVTSAVDGDCQVIILPVDRSWLLWRGEECLR
jgi:hypothetical protein